MIKNEFLIIGNQNFDNTSMNKLGIKIKSEDKKNIFSKDIFFKRKNNKKKTIKQIIKKKSILLIFLKLNNDLSGNILAIAKYLEIIRNLNITNLVYLINTKKVKNKTKKTKLKKTIINEIITSYNIIYKLNVLYKE